MGDRVEAISAFGESEEFQILAATTSSTGDEGGADADADGDDDAVGGDAVAEDTGDGDGGDDDGFRWGVVIGAVAGAPLTSLDGTASC